MASYKSVGFAEGQKDKKAKKAAIKEKVMEDDEKTEATEVMQSEEDLDKEDILASMPKQVKQYWMQTPTQYRLLYLLAFLYAH